jgi:hypothetical protein
VLGHDGGVEKVRRALVLASLVLCVGTPAYAQAPSFEAMGRAPITAGDQVRARQRALDEAMQRAVESAVSSLLGADTLTRRAADMRLKILPKAKSYVTSYRVLEEGETEPGIFDVHVAAEIATDRLLRELGDRPDHAAREAQAATAPVVTKLLLCLGGEPLPAPSHTDSAVRRQLSDLGYALVPASNGCEVGALVADMQAQQVPHALALMVSAQPATPIRGTSLVGREGKLTLLILEANGRPSANGNAEAAGFAANAASATDDLALRALPEAMSQVGTALSVLAGNKQSKEAVVPVRVVGARKLGQLAPLRQALERIPGVETVELRRVLPGIPATIELAVRTSQAPRTLADAVNRVGATYQLRAQVRDNTLVIEMMDPSDPGGGGDPPVQPGAP